MERCRRHRSGGKKTGPNPTDRGKRGVKRSLLTDGHGVPIGVAVDGANRHDMKLVREILEEFGFTAHIKARGDEAKELRAEAGKRARRWVVERSHSWMNRFRRILVRWDKKAENYIALLHFACALIAFRAAGLFG